MSAKGKSKGRGSRFIGSRPRPTTAGGRALAAKRQGESYSGWSMNRRRRAITVARSDAKRARGEQVDWGLLAACAARMETWNG